MGAWLGVIIGAGGTAEDVLRTCNSFRATGITTYIVAPEPANSSQEFHAGVQILQIESDLGQAAILNRLTSCVQEPWSLWVEPGDTIDPERLADLEFLLRHANGENAQPLNEFELLVGCRDGGCIVFGTEKRIWRTGNPSTPKVRFVGAVVPRLVELDGKGVVSRIPRLRIIVWRTGLPNVQNRDWLSSNRSAIVAEAASRPLDIQLQILSWLAESEADWLDQFDEVAKWLQGALNEPEEDAVRAAATIIPRFLSTATKHPRIIDPELLNRLKTLYSRQHAVVIQLSRYLKWKGDHESQQALLRAAVFTDPWQPIDFTIAVSPEVAGNRLFSEAAAELSLPERQRDELIQLSLSHQPDPSPDSATFLIRDSLWIERYAFERLGEFAHRNGFRPDEYPRSSAKEYAEHDGFPDQFEWFQVPSQLFLSAPQARLFGRILGWWQPEIVTTPLVREAVSANPPFSQWEGPSFLMSSFEQAGRFLETSGRCAILRRPPCRFIEIRKASASGSINMEPENARLPIFDAEP